MNNTQKFESKNIAIHKSIDYYNRSCAITSIKSDNEEKHLNYQET
jgi:hypothetical protein